MSPVPNLLLFSFGTFYTLFTSPSTEALKIINVKLCTAKLSIESTGSQDFISFLIRQSVIGWKTRTTLLTNYNSMRIIRTGSLSPCESSRDPCAVSFHSRPQRVWITSSCCLTTSQSRCVLSHVCDSLTRFRGMETGCFRYQSAKNS